MQRVVMTEEDVGEAAMEGIWYPKCPYCGLDTPAEPDADYIVCNSCDKRF